MCGVFTAVMTMMMMMHTVSLIHVRLGQWQRSMHIHILFFVDYNNILIQLAEVINLVCTSIYAF